MSDLKTQFETAVADSKNLPERPDNQTMLKMLRPLQAGDQRRRSGRAQGHRHGGPCQVGCLERVKGTSADDAMKQYVSLVKDLKD